jgi:hypothetical protein
MVSGLWRPVQTDNINNLALCVRGHLFLLSQRSRSRTGYVGCCHSAIPKLSVLNLVGGLIITYHMSIFYQVFISAHDELFPDII